MYKLKPEARQFFKMRANDVLPLEKWAELGVHSNLLCEMPAVYITEGIKEGSTTSLREWNGSDGAKLHFTLNVAEIDYDQYQDLDCAKLWDEIQRATDKYIKKYLKNS